MRLATLALLSLALVAITTTAVGAMGIEDGDAGNTHIRPSIGKTEYGYEVELVGTRTFGQTVTGPGVPAWLRACRWQTWTRLDKDNFFNTHFATTNTTPYQPPTTQNGDPNEPWGALFCSPGPEALGINPGITLSGLLHTWPLTNPPPQLVLDILIARAYASLELPLPNPHTAPHGDHQAPLITQLPTWLWIDPTNWTPRTATPPPIFGITVTATATPTNVTYTTNDNQTINCGNNNAPPYNFNLPDHTQHSPCTLTYHHASTTGNWTLTTTTRWTTTYTCNTTCGTGTLPDYVLTTTRPVRVAELQTLGTPNP